MTIPDARAEARKLIAAFTDMVKNDGGPRTPNGISLGVRDCDAVLHGMTAG